jgi:hypothetical protein
LWIAREERFVTRVFSCRSKREKSRRRLQKPAMEKPASAKGSNRISRRVVGLWEQLVGEALRAQEARGSLEIGSSRRRDYGSSSYTVPQFLQDQTNIESILQAARDIEPENIQVSQICKFSSRLSRFHFYPAMPCEQTLFTAHVKLDELIQKKNTRNLTGDYISQKEREVSDDELRSFWGTESPDRSLASLQKLSTSISN